MLEGFERTINSTKQKYEISFGKIIYYEDSKKLVFVNQDDNQIAMSKVHFLKDKYNKYEGEKNIPRPFIYIDKDTLKEPGDKLAYMMISQTEVLVLGSTENNYLHADKNLNTDYSKAEEIEKEVITRNNSNRYYLQSIDGKGNILTYIEAKEKGEGNVYLKIIGTEENGKFILDANGKITLIQRDKSNEKIAQVVFDNTEGEEKIVIEDKYKNKIELNKKGSIIETETIRIGKGTTLKMILIELLSAIQKMTHSTPTGATIPQPLNWSQFEQVKTKIEKFMDIQ